MSLIGDARVSTTKLRQVLSQQFDGFNEADCERIFEDRASGTDPGRPQLTAGLRYLRGGDVFIVLAAMHTMPSHFSQTTRHSAVGRAGPGAWPRLRPATRKSNAQAQGPRHANTRWRTSLDVARRARLLQGTPSADPIEPESAAPHRKMRDPATRRQLGDNPAFQPADSVHAHETQHRQEIQPE